MVPVVYELLQFSALQFLFAWLGSNISILLWQLYLAQIWLPFRQAGQRTEVSIPVLEMMYSGALWLWGLSQILFPAFIYVDIYFFVAWFAAKAQRSRCHIEIFSSFCHLKRQQ